VGHNKRGLSVNIFKNSNGKWESNVIVRRQINPELVEVIDRNPAAIDEYPDTRFWVDPYGNMRPLDSEEVHTSGHVIKGGSYTLYTRIFMGIVPLAGHEPGYCAVVGELFDGSFEPQVRPLFVLDEGVCWPDVDPSMALMPDLMEATCALKDIYLPLQERDSSSALGGDRRLIYSPGHVLFLEELRKHRHGITSYPDDLEVTDERLKERMPFFKSRDRVAPLFESPYREDEDYGIKVVEAMLVRSDRDGNPMLRRHECCSVLRDGQYRTPLKALALCCLTFQTYEWTEVLEGRWDYDGYPIEDEDVDQQTSMERKAEQEHLKMLHGALYMGAAAHHRAGLEKKADDVYKGLVGLMKPREEAPQE
jgi:hypothetical protein